VDQFKDNLVLYVFFVGILAKKAVEAGLNIAKFVRRSLCPGSGIVTSYLQESGVMPYLHLLGFEVMGYGCPSCVENFNKPVLAENDSVLIETIRHRGLTCVGVLSGNRNFTGRHNPGEFLLMLSFDS
jgi:aconitate hydratase